ncbi:MAG: ferrous iron transport protein A [Clostridia bacterium]|nr:ferrous iron transport protein A [Clostridia bacterium]
MPLVTAPTDMILKIIKVFAEGETKRHLENLGIMPGGSVSVIKSEAGNVIVKIKEGRIALNRQLAMKIFVA